jgi:GNAT superfamily N-acetyltransferase
MESALTIRLATANDIPGIRTLMDAAISQLLAPFLSPEAVAASFELMGLDTQLIADATYYVVESDGRLAGCGGWSRRATLFGGDHTAGRDAALLDPATEPARIRAMYTHPNFVRRGVGRLVLQVCEGAAAGAGFTRCELAATLGGEPLYRASGYEDIEAFEEPTSSGVAVPLIRMGKTLTQ